MMTDLDLMNSGLLGFVEILAGEVHTPSPNSYQQNPTSQNILTALEPFSAHGELLPSNLGYVLRRHGDHIQTLRLPDISYTPHTAIRNHHPDPKRLPSAPLLAVKVVAEYLSVAYLEAFITDFHEAGTKQVWLVYPSNETVDCYHTNGTIQHYTQADTLSVEDILPVRAELSIANFFVYPWKQ